MWLWRQFWGRLLRSENGVDGALIRAGVPAGAGLDELPVIPTLRQARREGFVVSIGRRGQSKERPRQVRWVS
jgi:hypothetical protein